MDVLSGGEKQRMAVSVYNEELIFWYVFGRVTKHQVLTQHSRVTPQELVTHFIFTTHLDLYALREKQINDGFCFWVALPAWLFPWYTLPFRKRSMVGKG